MESKAPEARTSMVESLKLIQDVYRKKPDPFMYLVQVVMDAKSDELINIYSAAFLKKKAVLWRYLLKLILQTRQNMKRSIQPTYHNNLLCS